MKTKACELAGLSARHHTRRGPFTTIVVLLVIASVSTRARAEDDEAVNRAYELAAEGLTAYKSGHYAEALDRLGNAFGIVKLPALAVHMARANVKLGRLVSAVALYRQAMVLGDGIGDPQVQARARAEAEAELSVLILKVPKLRIEVVGVSPSGVTVLVDGNRVSTAAYDSEWFVDPGTHQISASYGRQTQVKQATLSEGESRDIQLIFSQPSVAQTQPTSTHGARDDSSATTSALMGVSFGIGGTGLLLSGLTSLGALSNKHHADDTGCNQEPRRAGCDESAVNRYATLRTIAGVSFYTGLAGVIGGTALYFGTPRQKNTRDAKRHVLPWFGLESAGIEGSF